MIDDAAQLHKEWRELVLNELKQVKNSLDGAVIDINELKLNSIQKKDFKNLEERIRKLEETKTKIIATWAVIQSLIILAAWMATFFLR